MELSGLAKLAGSGDVWPDWLYLGPRVQRAEPGPLQRVLGGLLLFIV